ncbi:MAG: hypothetical protein M1828_007515 [Chrysothrix sp. TS-e1954]|nr:MAG: hypothetical protein M1828_007515 [Chrysothrix sp. TS-e1954]
MADSDEDYVEELSDNEAVANGNGSTGNRMGTRSGRANMPDRHPSPERRKLSTTTIIGVISNMYPLAEPVAFAQGPGRQRERWEDIQRSWDQVVEGADGSLAGTVEGLQEAEKRRRLLKDTTPLQRGIIRHLTLILDCSHMMLEKDLRPSRYLLTIRHSIAFITSFFEQNPISQIAVIGMRDGLAVRISPLSGNPAEHIAALTNLRSDDPKGNPSLQNALEMARAELGHTPSHGTREAVIVMGALLSADPGDIHATVRSLVNDKIVVSIIGLAARIAICSEIVQKTQGYASTAAADASTLHYGIAMHEGHFRELLLAHTTPPTTRASAPTSAPSLLVMGFPSRVDEEHPSLCACHSNVTKGGFLCTRCGSKVCSLPAQCPVCEMQLVQSTHLARSYHHLFPLRNYVEVSWSEARQAGSMCCFSCLIDFPDFPPMDENGDGDEQANGRTNDARGKQKRAFVNSSRKGASESSRYKCTTCGEHFCIDCDVYAHEILHNCGGCLSKPPSEYVGATEQEHRPEQGSGQPRGENGTSVHASGNGTASAVESNNGNV